MCRKLLAPALPSSPRGYAICRTKSPRLDTEIPARAKADDATRRLMSVPGIGPLFATAIALRAALFDADGPSLWRGRSRR